MNIRGGSKDRIDRKKGRLKKELEKEEDEIDYEVVDNIKQSLKRNLKIAKHKRTPRYEKLKASMFEKKNLGIRAKD